jgi:hypothetical protein
VRAAGSQSSSNGKASIDWQYAFLRHSIQIATARKTVTKIRIEMTPYIPTPPM